MTNQPSEVEQAKRALWSWGRQTLAHAYSVATKERAVVREQEEVEAMRAAKKVEETAKRFWDECWKELGATEASLGVVGPVFIRKVFDDVRRTLGWRE
jgi:hypothetical protein